MGYYSEVKLSTTKKGWEVIREHIKDKTSDTYVLNNASIETYRAGAYVLVSFESIKWYENYPQFSDVKAFMEGLSLLEEQKIPFAYARAGEEPGDVDYIQPGDMLSDMKELGIRVIVEEW